jgi:hypothetical protein
MGIYPRLIEVTKSAEPIDFGILDVELTKLPPEDR